MEKYQPIGTITVVPDKEPLPIKQKPEHSPEVVLATSKVHALVKKQAIQIVNGRPGSFEHDLTTLLQILFDAGYSRGLDHMDRMHNTLKSDRI